MANRRYFSVKKCQSPQFLNMSAGAQALYLAILGIVDDDGIFEIDFAKRVAGRRKQDMDALIANGYITVINDLLNIGYVTDWQGFNTIDKRQGTPSRYRQALIDTIPSIKNVLFKPQKTAYGAKISRIEENRIEEKKIKDTTTDQYNDEFAALWLDYPRKDGKQKGLKAYKKSRRAGATAQEIADGTHSYIERVRREKRDEKYIKTGGNFFQEELWREDHTVKRDPAVSDDAQELEGII